MSTALTADNRRASKRSIDWALMRRFFRYLKPYRSYVAVGIGLIPVSAACSILVPWLMMNIIDEQLSDGNFNGLMVWAGIFLLVVIVNYVADALFSFSLQTAALKAIRDVRQDMFTRILRFPRTYFDKTPMGVTLTRLTSDLEAISESFTQGLLGMLRDVIITVALLIFLFSISWRLTLVVMMIGPLVYAVTEYLRKRLRDSYLKARVILSQGTGYLQEVLSGIKTVQLYNAEKEVQQKYSIYTQGFFREQSKSNIYDAALFSCIEGITTLSMGLIIWYGSRELLATSITLGVLVGFIHTLDRIFVPIRDFTSQIASIQRTMAAFEHIEEVFEQPVEDEGENAPVLDQEMRDSLHKFESVEFDNVRFRYSRNGPYVLKGVSFKLEKGHQLALVGSTGSGKSTILRLLTRTYDHYEGSIRLNGIELNRIPKSEVGKFFALMQQEVFLFNETISFNISMGQKHISEQDIANAARYVYADEFIESLPGNYNFLIKDNGSNLSAGQAQLIAFARAIAGGNEVIMLDEATASVDSVTEQLIQKAINQVFAEKTVIAIAHRLSTIQHSDQILVLDEGKIAEQGTHQSLLDQEGLYSNLVKCLDQSTT